MIESRKEIEKLYPYVPGRPIDQVKKDLGLTEVIKLASNENPLGCSEKARKAIMDAFSDLMLYPDGSFSALRTLLGKKYDVSENMFIFGAGADEIIGFIGKTFISHGDEAVTAEVTFSQYAASVESMGGKMVYAPMKNLCYDLEAIAEKITDKTKIVFLTNPNNPTGSAFTALEQENLIKKIPKNILIVIDEAYAEFCNLEGFMDSVRLPLEYENVMVLRTFSKAYGLASLRIGYGIARPEIITQFEKIRPPFNVSTAAQNAACAALSDEEFLDYSVKSNREALEYSFKKLDEMGLSYVPSYTNFVLINVGRDSMEVFQKLMEKGYIIRPGKPLGIEGHIRVTIGTIPQMEGFFKALDEILN